MCLIKELCSIIFVRDLWYWASSKTFFLLVYYIDKSKKSDRQDKLSVFTYLLSIILYIINSRHTTSEYLHIRDYSDIHMIVSRIFWHFYEHVKNFFNMRVIVSIDTILYTCEICAYYIECFYGACWTCIGGSLTNFSQHTNFLNKSPASLAALWESSFYLSSFNFRYSSSALLDSL